MTLPEHSPFESQGRGIPRVAASRDAFHCALLPNFVLRKQEAHPRKQINKNRYILSSLAARQPRHRGDRETGIAEWSFSAKHGHRVRSLWNTHFSFCHSPLPAWNADTAWEGAASLGPQR